MLLTLPYVGGVESILVDARSALAVEASARMQAKTTTTITNAGRTAGQTRDCERCGRDRPTDPRRFEVTLSDYADEGGDYDKALLCGECWQHIQDEIRGCFA